MRFVLLASRLCARTVRARGLAGIGGYIHSPIHQSGNLEDIDQLKSAEDYSQ
jgi:hypothetical protein